MEIVIDDTVLSWIKIDDQIGTAWNLNRQRFDSGPLIA